MLHSFEMPRRFLEAYGHAAHRQQLASSALSCQEPGRWRCGCGKELSQRNRQKTIKILSCLAALLSGGSQLQRARRGIWRTMREPSDFFQADSTRLAIRFSHLLQLQQQPSPQMITVVVMGHTIVFAKLC